MDPRSGRVLGASSFRYHLALLALKPPLFPRMRRCVRPLCHGAQHAIIFLGACGRAKRQKRSAERAMVLWTHASRA